MATREDYLAKLRDPRWQQKRLMIFQRDQFTCQICGSKDRTLHLHHIAYSPTPIEPWESPDELLVTACELCHELEHPLRKEMLYTLQEMLAVAGIRTSIDLFRIIEKAGPVWGSITREDPSASRDSIMAGALGLAIQDWPTDRQKMLDDGTYYAAR